MVNKSVIQEKSFKETEIGKIPVDWKVSTLDEISLKVTDGSHFSPKESETGNKIIATVKDMEYYQFSFKNCKRIADEDFNLLVKNGCSPEKGDIIISKDGANCLDLIFVYNQDKKIVLLSSIAIVKLKKGFNSQFYRYYLLSPLAQKIMREGYVSGSAIPRVILTDFKKVPIPILPNIETQNKIADILSSLDDKIALNRQMNSTLEAIGQALFRRWFVDFEFPNEEGKSYRSSGGEMVEKELGEMPAGWRVGTLGEYVNVFKGCSYRSEDLQDSDKALVTLKAIERGGGFKLDGLKPYTGEYKQEQIISPGELVVAHTDLTQKAEVLGKPAIIRKVPLYSTLIASLDLSVVRSKNDSTNVPFVYFLLKTEDFQNHAYGYADGTTVLHLNKKAVPDYKFVLPQKDLVKKFGNIIIGLLNKIQNNELESDVLSSIRDALLPKLMSGEIRVGMK